MTAQAVRSYESAVGLLPSSLRGVLDAVPMPDKAAAEEFRFRVGKPLTVVLPEGERALPAHNPVIVKPRDLEAILETATQGSAHTVLESTRAGFVTVRGGHRLGLCGTVAVRDGAVSAIRCLSSLCLRVAREMPGAADGLLAKIRRGASFYNTLIVSPPGLGKTTLLRDLIRQASEGGVHGAPRRVALADERSEVAASYLGQPQLDVGAHTDVLDGCSKANAMIWLLRGLSPQILAADEITSPADIAAMETAVGCGVSLFATAHADGPDDLLRRPLYRGLPELFQRLIVIRRENGRRVYDVREMPHSFSSA